VVQTLEKPSGVARTFLSAAVRVTCEAPMLA